MMICDSRSAIWRNWRCIRCKGAPIGGRASSPHPGSYFGTRRPRAKSSLARRAPLWAADYVGKQATVNLSCLILISGARLLGCLFVRLSYSFIIYYLKSFPSQLRFLAHSLTHSSNHSRRTRSRGNSNFRDWPRSQPRSWPIRAHSPSLLLRSDGALANTFGYNAKLWITPLASQFPVCRYKWWSQHFHTILHCSEPRRPHSPRIYHSSNLTRVLAAIRDTRSLRSFLKRHDKSHTSATRQQKGSFELRVCP